MYAEAVGENVIELLQKTGTSIYIKDSFLFMGEISCFQVNSS